MALMSLYKIADALQMPIHYDGKTVSGSRKAKVRTAVGLPIPLQLAAKAVFFSEQVGVLAHVVGKLYILVAHYPEKGGFSAYIIDGAKIKEESHGTTDITKVLDKKMKLIEAMEVLGGSVAGAFFLKQGLWTELTLPKR